MKALQIKKQLSENDRQQMRVQQMREQLKNEFKELYSKQLDEQKKSITFKCKGGIAKWKR
jgi:Txe/YoeB family toxin of Txe-Axe toxin-antitoxin module